jgi:hypothetical protein
MPDVSRPGRSVDDLYVRQHPEMRGEPTDPGNHTQGRRVGVFGFAMQCQTCGSVCMPYHETFTVTRDGETWTIPGGAWLDGDGINGRHLFPFDAPAVTQGQDDTSPQSLTEDAASAAPKPRPESIPAGAPRRSRTTPSRSKDARHAEYIRGKRRRVQAQA